MHEYLFESLGCTNVFYMADKISSLSFYNLLSRLHGFLYLT